MINSSPEVSLTAQLAQVRTETLYGVKRRMNLRLLGSVCWCGFHWVSMAAMIEEKPKWPDFILCVFKAYSASKKILVHHIINRAL